jgi:hypothetical protein
LVAANTTPSPVFSHLHVPSNGRQSETTEIEAKISCKNKPKSIYNPIDKALGDIFPILVNMDKKPIAENGFF